MMKDFMKNFICLFSVLSFGMCVGVVVYLINFIVVFILNQYVSFEGVEEVIDNIVYLSGGMYSGKVLYQMVNKFFDDVVVWDNVLKVLVFFMDGVFIDDVI